MKRVRVRKRSRNHDTGVKADKLLGLPWFAQGRASILEAELSITGTLLSIFEGQERFMTNTAKSKERQRSRENGQGQVGTCSGGGRLNDLSGKIEPFCIEFTDPGPKPYL